MDWNNAPGALVRREHFIDVLEGVVVYLFYLGENTRAIRDRLGNKRLEPRALYSRALKRARRLLHVIGRGGAWTLNPNWQERLRLAGVDPETLGINNIRWAALCWEQLVDMHFSAGEQRLRIGLQREPDYHLFNDGVDFSFIPKRKPISQPYIASAYLGGIVEEKVKPLVTTPHGRKKLGAAVSLNEPIEPLRPKLLPIPIWETRDP